MKEEVEELGGIKVVGEGRICVSEATTKAARARGEYIKIPKRNPQFIIK
jgi:hypothetical protein